MTRAVRIGNCSGFYGDRVAAAKEMVDGGPIDVLTGDYLAELTMLILWKAQQKDPEVGYAKTFLTQMRQVLADCLDRGIKVVSNAGGLNPAGLAEQLGKLAGELGLQPRIAYVYGDNLVDRVDELTAAGYPLSHLDTGQTLSDAGIRPVSANAYLGGWGIAQALTAGADIVICPRVTDASLVVGPAAWWHGWKRTDYDALAGAVAAGHVIECGPQATGGNYSWLHEITNRSYPGFPIAEVAGDGTTVITKHPGTGGLVSPGTVTAQLMYEIAEPQYLNPDVVTHFNTLHVEQEAPDRVLISGSRGTPPPQQLKVAVNYLGGYRNTMTLVLTGLDIEDKAAWAEQELFEILGGNDRFAEVNVQLIRFDHPDAESNVEATAHLRITVKDPDAAKVGRHFSNAVMELALAGYAGFHTTTPPSSESAYGVYWPTVVPVEAVQHRVVLPEGAERVIEHGPTEKITEPIDTGWSAPATTVSGETAHVPLGRLCAARSGDKGGNANVGFWTRETSEFHWLRSYLTVDRLHALLPEAADLEIRRFELANLNALNFVIVGFLGDGVASATRPDPQAKGLGEYLRSRYVDIPIELVAPYGVIEGPTT